MCRLWCPLPGGSTAREQLASNPRNGPFRPTSAALSSTRCSPASSWTSSSKSKDDFKFKDAATSSSRTRSRSPRPSMSRRSDPLPQQDIFISRLQPGIPSEPKDEIAAIVDESVRSLKAFSDELLHDFRPCFRPTIIRRKAGNPGSPCAHGYCARVRQQGLRERQGLQP